MVAANLETARAEVHDRPSLPRLVEARVPEGWPPPLNDEGSMRWVLSQLEKDPPDAGGWSFWYLALPGESTGERILVGNAGFKGRPAADGTVEIGYSVMEDRQRQGFGTEAAEALMKWAFSHPDVRQVVAETYPELRPSVRVMERIGMVYLGVGSEEGVV